VVVEPPPVVTPESISATQIRVWLVRNGVTSQQIDQIIETIPDEATREEARVRGEYSPYIERSHPLVSFVGDSLGLDGPSMDAAFIEASGY